MTDPRDRLDDWLATDVTPLRPPPGTLDRIRHRARRRKARQVVVASGACAILLGAVVAAPQIAGSLRGSKPPPVAGNQSPPLIQPSGAGPSSTPASGETQSAGPIQGQQHTTLSATTSGTVPPGHFRPTSVTFVGDGQGVVGAVIGQAGPPCATSDCTSLAGTSNYGASWYGVSAPYAPGPSGGAGVSQLRFANMKEGWAFGPALQETTGGGWPWKPVNTAGQRVIDLEAYEHSAFAIFATCSGSGADYASDCTSFTLYQGGAGSTTFTPVDVPPGYQRMVTAQPSSAQLVIAAGTGYLLTPSGALLSGPASGGPWKVIGQAPCTPGAAQQSGLPSGAQLAANQQQLLVACAAQPGAPAGQVALYTSSAGASWQLAGTVPSAGSLTSVTSAAAGQVVLATTNGLYYSPDGGGTWQSAGVGAAAPDGGFSYVGMTNSSQGVAVPADSSLGEVYVTGDGGKTWRPSPIAG